MTRSGGPYFRASISLTMVVLAAGVVATMGASWLAKVIVAKQSVASAFNEAAGDFFGYPQASLFLLAPWIGLACLTFSNRRKQRRLICLLPYIVAVTLSLYLYIDAQLATTEYVQERMWTAASLTTGFSAFYAVAIVIVAAVVSRLLARATETRVGGEKMWEKGK